MARLFLTNADHLDNAVPCITAMPAAGMTISAWIKATTLLTLQEILTLGQAASNSNRWTIDVNAASTFSQSQARDGAAASFGTATAAVTSGVWCLVTGVFYDDTNRAGFTNGANKGTGAVLRTLASAPTNTRVSANPIGNNPVLNGLLAHLAIWNTALVDTDVLALMTNLPSSIQPSFLQEYWPLTTGASPEPSIGIQGNSLTVTGTSFAADDPFGSPVVLMGQAIF